MSGSVRQATPPAVGREPVSENQTTVLVVDGHRLVGAVLCRALRDAGNDAHQILVADHDVMLAAAANYPAGVVLVEPAIGSGESGRNVRVPELVAALTGQGNRVLALAGNFDDPMIGAMVAAGACGAVPKSAPLDTLLGAVTAVAGGRLVMSSSSRARWVDTFDQYRQRVEARMALLRRLSPRELEVLRLLAAGYRASAISEHLVTAMPTVRTQIASVLTKLEVSSQLEAVALLHRAAAGAERVPSRLARR